MPKGRQVHRKRPRWVLIIVTYGFDSSYRSTEVLVGKPKTNLTLKTSRHHSTEQKYHQPFRLGIPAHQEQG